MGISAYPLVPGQEAIGTIVAAGQQVRGLPARDSHRVVAYAVVYGRR
jgi:NADPH:quinone reductase-like Zn-dependent oxidoreductase